MMIKDFVFSNIPKTIFGAGTFGKLASVLDELYVTDREILIVTGKSFTDASKHWDVLNEILSARKIRYLHYILRGEPSPEFVDLLTAGCRGRNTAAVLSIGGGSVIDAGKAVSAMLTKPDSVTHYLDVVGDKKHDGVKIPFIAVPTTAGTGSEATKNAVLSCIWENGYKRSLRHDKFVPDYAIIDPDLTLTCPREITVACGMDAFTQLLEAFVSTDSSPMTDSLALSGLEYIKEFLVPVCVDSSLDIEARSGMSYAAYLSGITLANAGLGVVHGLASEIGGYFAIPHGVVCANLVGEATKVNTKRLYEKNKGSILLRKYALIGELFSDGKYDDVNDNVRFLIDTIDSWIDILEIPPLGKYGFAEENIEKVLATSTCKNNPVKLSMEDMRTMLLNRI